MKSFFTRKPLPLSVVDTVGEDILIKVKDGLRLRSKSKKLGCRTPLNGPLIFGLKIEPKLEDRLLKLGVIFLSAVRQNLEGQCCQISAA